MISSGQLALLKRGSLLINASRGTVLDCEALAEAIRNKHIAGAAIDVFPEEPSSNSDPFRSVLQEFENVILTPHIGGSTQEAQENIGYEVTEKLIRYSDNGSTIGAVNFPQLSLQPNDNKQRFLHIHHNMPGILKNINDVFTNRKINISAEYLQTDGQIGYVIIDTDSDLKPEIIGELKKIPHTIRARMLY
jgi:D-3-phosphoglycerate dehydrogenase